MNQREEKLANMPMPKLVMNMSVPLMLSLLIQSLYNIVDSIFVAKIGQNALTAVSVAYPLQILMIAVAVGSAVGVNALLSKNVGAKNHEALTNIATTGLLISLFCMLIFMIVGIFLSGTFARSFTDNQEIAELSAQYLTICMIFCGGMFIQTMYQRFVQAVGDTVGSMISLASGAIVNIILDPILIFGMFGMPKLGIRGAAIATVLGQWIGASVAIMINRKINPMIRARWRGYRLDPQILKLIYKVGFPTIIMQAIGSVMVAAMNRILMPFSSTTVAFFGVYYKLQSFLFMPMNGLGQAAIPIVGFNYGAGNKKRLMEVFKVILPAAIGISLIATLVFLAVPDVLLSWFQADEAMLSCGIPALRIISITFAFASVTMVLGYAVSGLGNGMVNMVGNALRQLILLVPLAYIFGRCLGVDKIWYAFWISETVAVIFAICATRKVLKRKL